MKDHTVPLQGQVTALEQLLLINTLSFNSNQFKILLYWQTMKMCRWAFAGWQRVAILKQKQTQVHFLEACKLSTYCCLKYYPTYLAEAIV